uniref:Uncharacterized protein n=1 Tax=Steinernema glaseri TaxID=37863 RepID=A0A1I8AEA5_9BILA
MRNRDGTLDNAKSRPSTETPFLFGMNACVTTHEVSTKTLPRQEVDETGTYNDSYKPVGRRFAKSVRDDNVPWPVTEIANLSHERGPLLQRLHACPSATRRKPPGRRSTIDVDTAQSTTREKWKN